MRHLMTTAAKSLIAASLALALTATATHSSPCPERSEYVPEDALTSTYPVYVTFDSAACGCYRFTVWIYAESNGDEGLQRDDGFCYTPGTTEDTRDWILF